MRYGLKVTDLFGVAVSENRIVVELFCSVDERTSHETLLTTTSFIAFFRVVTLTPRRWMNDSRALIVSVTYTVNAPAIRHTAASRLAASRAASSQWQLDSCTGLGSTRTFRKNPAEMENVAGLPQDAEEKAEMKTHFTVMQLPLCVH